MSLIESMFLKTCPHCGKATDIRHLRMIPRPGPLHWYQFTPSAQAACPACGGLVKSTAENSPILIVGFGALIAISLAAALSPMVRSWIALFPAAPYLLALSALLLVWFVLKQSELVPRK